MDPEMSTRLYGYYVNSFIEISNNFRKEADPKTFESRIKEIITSEEFSNSQKVVLVKIEHKYISGNIKKTKKEFEKLGKIINKDAKNIKYADGKNLATLTAQFISETDNSFLLERYYKLFNVFVKNGVDPMHKDNSNLNAFDYIFWAKESAQRDLLLAQLKENPEKTK